MQLSQQATLETRQAKHEPRSLAEQRAPGRERRSPSSVAAAPPELLEQCAPRAHRRRTRSSTDGLVQPDGRPSGRGRSSSNEPPGRAGTSTPRPSGRSGGRRCRPRGGGGSGGRASSRTVGRSGSVRARRHHRAVRAAACGRDLGLRGRRVDLFTSSHRVLAAEARLVAVAGAPRRLVVGDERRSTWRCCESTANGVDAQRRPGRPGARAWPPPVPGCSWRSRRPGPARPPRCAALASAWTDGGGTVIGLAPSAAAADALAQQMGAPDRHPGQADPPTRVTHDRAAMPAWVAGIDSSTLVVIDEAGMADTAHPGRGGARTSSSAAAASG